MYQTAPALEAPELTPFQTETLDRLARGEVDDSGEKTYISGDVLSEVKQVLLALNDTFSWGRKVFIDGDSEGRAMLGLDPFGHIFWTTTDVAVQPIGGKLVPFPRTSSRMVASVANFLAELAKNYQLSLRTEAARIGSRYR